MPEHNFDRPRGRTVEIEIDSRALRGNLLGDPASRVVAVYLPEGAEELANGCPLLVDLTGYTGSGLKHLAWQAFGENVPQRIDRLIAAREIEPVAVAFPDCFTSLGGNQYVNSIATGRWEDFLLEEMLPELERRLPIRGGPAARAVFGKSSGGYGALVQALRHGGEWAGAACMSGDIGFEIAYARDFPAVLDELARHDGSIERFLEHLRIAPKVRGKEMHVLMILAMGAMYDPDPDGPAGIRLPVDPRTCERIPERWQAWLDHDPLELVERPKCRENLGRLRGLWIECGSRDQYHIHFGARALAARLEHYGVAHHYEEFDDDHSSIDYRMDVVLPYLGRLLRD